MWWLRMQLRPAPLLQRWDSCKLNTANPDGAHYAVLVLDSAGWHGSAALKVPGQRHAITPAAPQS